MILKTFKVTTKAIPLSAVITLTSLIGVTETSNAQRRNYDSYPYSQSYRAVPSQIKFQNTVHDFDTIAEVDGIVSCEFEFTNVSKEAYAIGSTGVSCGCTTPEYSKAPVQPGGKARIKIFFDPKNRPGYFEKSILVVSAKNRSLMDRIYIKGYVKPRPRTIEDDYPIYIGKGLRVKHTKDSLGYVAMGKFDTLIIGTANTSDQPIELDTSIDPYQPAVHSTHIVPTILQPNQKGEVRVVIDGNQLRDFGRFDSYVRIRVKDSEANELDSIAINTFIVENIQPSTTSPKISIDRDYHHFGAYDDGDSTVSVRKFTIKNNGDAPLMIRKIVSSHPNLTAIVSNNTLEANSSADMVVSFDVTGIPLKDGDQVNRLIENLDLYSNDPSNPVLKLRMAIAVLPKREQ